jgi:hypothetical protein
MAQVPYYKIKIHAKHIAHKKTPNNVNSTEYIFGAGGRTGRAVARRLKF